jgi:hypothetical protein
MSNMSNINKSNIYKHIIFSLVCILAVYLISSFLVSQQVSKAKTALSASLSNHEEKLIAVAKQAADNKPSVLLKEVVPACSDTTLDRFYTLLAKLDSGLARNELTELQSLFSSCGNFNAVHKSVIASEFKQTLTGYLDLVSLYEEVTGETYSQIKTLPHWDTLTKAEIEESQAYSKLVVLQEEIILALIDGAVVGSDQINEILGRVNQVQKDLANANIEASSARTALGLR